MPTLEERLGLLEDERDILQTLYRYGHSLDDGREEMFMDCWTPDAVLHWPDRPAIAGEAALREAFRAHSHAPLAWHKHMLFVPQVVVSGDRATVDSMFARLDRYASGPGVRSFGRYRDVLLRCADGRWRLQERVAEREATRGDLAPGR
jgi:ketosteroid isomerase-like protein